MDIVVEELAPMRVAGIRHVGPFNQIGQAFGQLGQIAGSAGLMQAPGAVMLGVYHDDPRSTPPDQLRSDAAVVVSEDASVPDGLAEQVIAGGRYAKATHIGPFDGLPGAWAELTDWMASEGHRAATGPSLEVYRSDMASTPPQELNTDLYIALDASP